MRADGDIGKNFSWRNFLRIQYYSINIHTILLTLIRWWAHMITLKMLDLWLINLFSLKQIEWSFPYQIHPMNGELEVSILQRYNALFINLHWVFLHHRFWRKMWMLLLLVKPPGFPTPCSRPNFQLTLVSSVIWSVMLILRGPWDLITSLLLISALKVGENGN